jgi:capsular polysaccharide export protein
VFWAAYGRYTRYVDPIAERPCEPEVILDRIADHRRAIAANTGRVFCFGFQWWKRPVARSFLGGPGAQLEFARSARAARRAGIARGDRIVVWGMRGDGAASGVAQELGIPVERLEDGFLRSVGLGSDLVRPASLILDRRGIYFDARGPSDLEELFARHEFTAAELARGQALIERLRASGITKYNTGRARSLELTAAGPRRRILVPGQVEDDASIQTGCVDIRSNGALLEAVRAAEPEAYLVYKPHPDVLAGNRRGAVEPGLLARCADRVVDDCDMAACLRAVDAVHTLTSLTGFEALIHGKEVAVHGLPFYAGWGLTRDRHRSPRRGRPLPLAALVVAALAHYPRYLHWKSGLFTGPEAIIDDLATSRAGRDPTIGISWIHRMLRKLRGSLIGH